MNFVTAQGWAGAAALYTQEHVDGWKKVNQSVHQADGVIFCQLWHMGRTAGRVFHGLQPVAASAIAAEGRVTDYDGTKHDYEVPQALSVEGIQAAVEQFRLAARHAKEAGFDGIEIHGANGEDYSRFSIHISNFNCT